MCLKKSNTVWIFKNNVYFFINVALLFYSMQKLVLLRFPVSNDVSLVRLKHLNLVLPLHLLYRPSTYALAFSVSSFLPLPSVTLSWVTAPLPSSCHI